MRRTSLSEDKSGTSYMKLKGSPLIRSSLQSQSFKNEQESIKRLQEWQHLCPCDLWQPKLITLSNQCLCEEIDLEKELVLFFYETIMDKCFLREYSFAGKTDNNLFDVHSIASVRNEEIKASTKDIRKISRDDMKKSLVGVGGNQIALKKVGKATSKVVRRDKSFAKSRRSAGTSGSIRTDTHFPSSTTDKLMASSNFEYDWLIKRDETNAKIFFKNGNEYEGDVLDKVPHGNGTFWWSDGTIYEGEFKNGTPTGSGKMRLPDLTEYIGSFSSGYFHGNGVYNIRTTNMVYSGGWNYGKKNGKGWLLYEPGVWYEGEFQDNLRHGKGFFQYKKDNCYEGSYSKNKRHGEGAMRWPNNDIYIGQWSNGRMNGLGEYCWKTNFDNTFSFPVQHHYKGYWVDGTRTGTGIMFFGNENGAKMAGVFLNNFKHGAAIVVCGNGRSIERNPLFYNDKPVHVNMSREAEQKENSASEMQDGEFFRKAVETSLSLDINQWPTRTRLSDVSIQCLDHSEMKKEESLCSPIEINIHSPPEDVKLMVYIEKALCMYEGASDTVQFDLESNESSISSSTNSTNSKMHLSKWNLMTLYSCRPSRMLKSVVQDTCVKLSDSCPFYSKADIKFQRTAKNEERYLRNVIIRHLPNLMEVYYHYATITSPKKVYFKHYMIRMFLWQLYLDIGITKLGISLVEIDQFLYENGSSFIESCHHPFEHIYFFQYLQSLMGTALLVCNKNKVQIQSNEGLTSHIFERFLLDFVFSKAGSHQGRCLFEYKDLLPMSNIYSLYCKLGEPHTARTFLNMLCTKKGEEPACYKSWCNDKTKSQETHLGHNANAVGHNFIFVPEQQDIGSKPEEPLESGEEIDKFYRDLSTFRELGPKVIVQCLSTVCPPILINGIICNMEYPMTFIEFYEVLICCTLLSVAKKRIFIKKISEEDKSTDVELELETISRKSATRSKKKKLSHYS